MSRFLRGEYWYEGYYVIESGSELFGPFASIDDAVAFAKSDQEMPFTVRDPLERKELIESYGGQAATIVTETPSPLSGSE